MGLLASLLGARMLLGAPGFTEFSIDICLSGPFWPYIASMASQIEMRGYAV